MQSHNQKNNQLYLLFYLDQIPLALPIERVEGALLLPEIQILPEAKDMVVGFFEYLGATKIVIDLRPLFQMEPCEFHPSQSLVLLSSPYDDLALWVDQVSSVVKGTLEDQKSLEAFVPKDSILPKVLKTDAGLIYLPHLEHLKNKLDLDEFSIESN
ncbi:MAG: chemotaxis protein CheW [Planctomycetota bacterium]|nr:MAG: chemotaxis protein CheW [Planctomycetota bacterium]